MIGRVMIGKISYILDRGQKIKLLLLLILIVIGSFLETLGVSAILPLVSIISDPSRIDDPGSKYFYFKNLFHIPDVESYILLLSIGMIVIFIVKNVFFLVMYGFQYKFVFNNQRKLSYRLLEAYVNQDYMFHVSHNVADLRRNCTTDVNGFFAVVLNLIQLITEGVVCLFLISFLMMQDVATTVAVIMIMGLFLVFVLLIYRKKMTAIGEEIREIASTQGKWFLQLFGGIKEIKAQNKESFFLSKYDECYRIQTGASLRQSVLSILPRPLMETLAITGLLGFIAIRIFFGAPIEDFIPTMSVFAVASIRMLPSFNRISGCVGQIMYNKPSLDAIYEDLHKIDDIIDDRSGQRDKARKDIVLKKGIFIKNVSFAYPTNPEKIILDNVSIDIPVNRSVAFIGASGAGKTTMADIILGVLSPVNGCVLADDMDIRDDLFSWHGIVGYIPQVIYIMDDTIRNNVAFGEDPENIDDEKIWRALEESQLTDFVREQPDGLDSNIGAGGVKISGGQRQRIGIARALYRNPQVLILDEATSALDNDTEAAVMESIDRLAGKKTLIIIAHRLSTIENCDQIYEFGNGKVSEHNE